MGMRLEEMRHVSQLSPEARQGQSLTGAHMPTRGFYQIKSKQAVRQTCWGLPLGWRLHRESHDSTVKDSPQTEDVSGPDALNTQGSHVVIEMKAEQQLSEQAAESPAFKPSSG